MKPFVNKLLNLPNAREILMSEEKSTIVERQFFMII